MKFYFNCMNDILFCFLFQLFFDYTQPLHGFKPKKIEERILLFKLLLKVKEFFYIFYVKESRAQANARAKRNRYKHIYNIDYIESERRNNTVHDK